MLLLEFSEELTGGPYPTISHIFQSLPDAFARVGAGCAIESVLVLPPALYGRLTIHLRHEHEDTSPC